MTLTTPRGRPFSETLPGKRLFFVDDKVGRLAGAVPHQMVGITIIRPKFIKILNVDRLCGALMLISIVDNRLYLLLILEIKIFGPIYNMLCLAHVRKICEKLCSMISFSFLTANDFKVRDYLLWKLILEVINALVISYLENNVFMFFSLQDKRLGPFDLLFSSFLLVE